MPSKRPKLTIRGTSGGLCVGIAVVAHLAALSLRPGDSVGGGAGIIVLAMLARSWYGGTTPALLVAHAFAPQLSLVAKGLLLHTSSASASERLLAFMVSALPGRWATGAGLVLRTWAERETSYTLLALWKPRLAGLALALWCLRVRKRRATPRVTSTYDAMRT